MLMFADVIEALTGIRPPQAAQVITDAVIDSRKAIPGSLFVALPGERVDGHEYVQDAFRHGAAFALIQRDVDPTPPVLDLRPGAAQLNAESITQPLCLRVNDTLISLQQVARFWSRKLAIRTIGITGSVGKSTTKEVTTEVLSQRYRTLKNLGNLNNEIGLPLTLLRANENHERIVLEMGFYVPGEIALLCDIAQPQVGVVTNIGTVHAERAGTQETIATGKAELVESLPEDGLAILNYDDPWVRQMAARSKARCFYYGATPEADLWADRIEGLGLDGIRFRLHYQEDLLHVRIPMIGRHSVHTALRAAAVGLSEGLTWQEIINGLRSGHSQLRLVAVRSKSGALVLDDTYNASPESTLAALTLLSELEGRKIAVLGDMLELGRYERQGHEMVGLRAAEIVSELITVGQRAQIIAEAAQQAGLSRRRITVLDSSEEAILYLQDRLSEQDVVLIKGSRSMHMETIVESLELQR